jgi:uroporphyrinogen III methyltransferase / synthase
VATEKEPQAGKGKIYLVGAGPGDPELATLRAVRAIREAQVLVYDYLVNPELLEYASPECEKIYVGKKAGCHTLRQEEINSLLVGRASAGQVVCRLKGGDPFVFGRGGEEALAAAGAGIEFEVVPGVTAGVAAPAYAGIPVTQRGMASSVTFVTGHEDPAKEESDLDWAHLARSRGTLVFYMGVSHLGAIASRLIAGGMDPQTPAAVVHRGTTASQRTVEGPLAGIEERALAAGLEAPSVIIVGHVAALREKLNWYETRPLFGRTILVTRTREQASGFSKLLREQGARVIEMATIRIEGSPDPSAVEAALGRLATYDWIVFTSANWVERFLSRLFDSGRDVRALGEASLCAIGPATAAALERYGLRVDRVPESYVAESLAGSFAEKGDLKGKKILLPRAEIARRVIPEALRSLGAEVDEVAVYSTRIEAPDNLEEVRSELALGKIDAVTFTSSSTVENFVRLIGEETLARLRGRVLFAAIGPITAQKASDYNLEPLISSSTYTVPALADLLREHFFQQKRPD